MKKTLLATALLVAALTASATSVEVGAVNDYTMGQAGERVSLGLGTVYGLTPVISATHVNASYNRYAVGAEYALFKTGPVTVAVTGSGAYQQTLTGGHGYGLSVGVKTELVVAKGVSLYAGYERFAGQKTINAFNGNLVSVGAKIAF